MRNRKVPKFRSLKNINILEKEAKNLITTVFTVD